MHIKNYKKSGGFTLIELMVSITLFTVVLTVTLGSILTISDSNKKARSLMSVMTNLNFAVDSIVRSFKTGEIKDVASPVSASGKCLTTNEINYATTGVGEEFDTREVTYCFDEPNHKITKKVGNNSALDLTAPDVRIDYLKFDITGEVEGDQPMVTITIEGTVIVSPKISSQFSIQTSVAQRKLNI